MNTRSLTADQSRNLLQFCRSAGATLFTVNFLFVEGEEKRMQGFYGRLSPFLLGERD